MVNVVRSLAGVSQTLQTTELQHACPGLFSLGVRVAPDGIKVAFVRATSSDTFFEQESLAICSDDGSSALRLASSFMACGPGGGVTHDSPRIDGGEIDLRGEGDGSRQGEEFATLTAEQLERGITIARGWLSPALSSCDDDATGALTFDDIVRSGVERYPYEIHSIILTCFR